MKLEKIIYIGMRSSGMSPQTIARLTELLFDLIESDSYPGSDPLDILASLHGCRVDQILSIEFPLADSTNISTIQLVIER